MNSSKQGVRLIADICRARGIRYAVFSPGSRSAPLVIAFSQIPEIECIVIPDERVAGYFALGIAQQTQQPVAVICTSGTAVLNLGPALCEAYYQDIPMLFLTADRPEGAAEKGENQAINQVFLFKEMTNASYDANADASTDEELNDLGWLIENAIDETLELVPGPVHVNVRLSEPLYELVDDAGINYDLANQIYVRASSGQGASPEFKKQLAATGKKLVVVGMRPPDKLFSEKIKLLSLRQDTVVLTETAANVSAFNNYDACLDLIERRGVTDFIPEMVITFGNQIISKKLRQVLKANKPLSHWDISPYSEQRNHNIFDVPTSQFSISESDALDCFVALPDSQSSFASKWKDIHQAVENLSRQYFHKIEFSDLKVFETLTKAYPEGAFIQYGNSTPIRYSNFFSHNATLHVNANRGASGIDGCVSTAAGAAYATKQLTICVVGDVSFLYDSNALWNNYLAPGLRIIVINNSGGNIFRLLNGPTQVNDFEKFFETKHHLTARHLAEMYDIPYYFCDHQERLEKILATFFHPHNGKPAILEIKTDGPLSAEIYKGYFDYLKTNKPD